VANNLVFFAVHADDVARARRFYEKVFGWKFQPWGPPDFFLATTGTKDDPGVAGALQKRHELVPGKDVLGYECTIGVADVDAAMAAVEAHGGKVILPKCEIPTVGYLFKFRDTEGNVACAKQPYGGA
jgi:predicted enzyme related to lactoylglutathione lyase